MESEAFLRAHPSTRFVDVLLADLNGVLRGKRVTQAELAEVYRGGFYLPGSMFALTMTGKTVEATGLGFDEGDADRSCLPLEGSLVPVPWNGESVAQVQVSMVDEDGQPFYGDPRNVLREVLGHLRLHGLTPVVALELEFYFVDAQRTPEGGPQPPRLQGEGRRDWGIQINSMNEVDRFSAVLAEIAAHCEIQQVPTASALAECGPGQYEVNLRHVTDACLACDQVVRLKRIVRSVALRHGMEATFMPKPYAGIPGSGAHIHVSLLDREGRNVFAHEDPFGNQSLRHAIGGLAATMTDSMLVFAPTANSYRRFCPEAYVPLSPTWGYNNRGVALRIPASNAENRRFEHRVAGADVNPYLLTAVVLAGLLRGLEQELDPGEPLTGNPYGNPPTLPTNWPEAVAAFERSAFIRDYLGPRFQKLYATTRRAELAAFDSHVTPLEHTWYLSTA